MAAAGQPVCVADLYKELIDITKIPIVFMGMPWSVHLIDSNSQLRRRVTYRFVLPPFKISDEESLRDYMRFMCILAEKFGFADSINLRDIATCYRIFSYTEGNLGVTYELFRDVYMRADSGGCAATYDVMKKVVARYRDRGATNPLELAIDKVRFRELTEHSDWHFGHSTRHHRMIDPEFTNYGVNKKLKIYELAA